MTPDFPPAARDHDVSVRPLVEEEWETYRAVRIAALRDAPAAFGGSIAQTAGFPEETWRDWCRRPSWFAFDGEEPVGMVRIAPGDDFDVPELVSMWVAPAARGTNTARDLVGAVLDWATLTGRRGVRLHVFETNARARRLYERLGFIDTGARLTHPDGRVEIEMRHALT